jgi:hypothetical protein
VYLEKFDPRRPLKKLYGSVEVLLSLAALAERSREAGAGLYALAAVHDKALEETYEGKAVMEWLEGASFYVPQLNTPEFLAGVLKSYACPNENDCCLGKVDIERLVSLISSHDAYTLVAKYTGLWLKERGCDAEKLEEALKSSLKPSKAEPKLYLAHNIWHVLLRGNGDLARKAAVPLLLHAVFGPVPEGVTYITKAVKNGVWRFLKPEELEGASLESLREDALEPIANWLAQRHEDLVEETLRDLAGLNDEEARKPYKEALSGLIEALDWARGEVLKEGGKILVEFNVPEERRVSAMALLAFVAKRLAAVFKSGESRRCRQRTALIAGYVLAGYPVLPRREWLHEDVVETLGDALEPCAVDDYLTIDDKIPWLSIGVALLMPIRELNMLSPLADAYIIKAVKKTAEGLLVRWRRSGFNLTEVFYALGLAALAAGAEVDGETADLLLYAASAAVQRVAHPVAVLPVLEALRPLGEKAPHRYVVALAAASELTLLNQETAEYIYDAFRQLKNRLLEAERRRPLVEAVRAYSNLLTKHSAHIKDRWEDAVADMCRLYGEVRKRDGTTAPDSGLLTHRLFDAVARAYVLAVALESDVLAQHVQRHCSLSDLIKETEAVRGVLDEAAAHPEELRKIMENEDFAKWVTARNITDDPGEVVEDLSAWFTAELARYKLVYALDERGELDEKKLEEAAEEFEKVAEMRIKLKQLENYLTARSRALRARVLAAKSREELLERAKGFLELWKEAEKHLKLTAEDLETAAGRLGECLVYMAASGDRERAEELLKEWRWLLDYVPEVSVVARLMLRVLGVGEGARLKEVVDVFEPWLSSEHLPALSMLAGRLQRDEAPEECAKISNAQPPEAEVCVDTVAAATGNQVAAERLRSEIEKLVPEARLLLDRADGRTLVEVLAPEYSWAQVAFMLLAAVEGRSDAVRLHGLLGSVAYRDNVSRPLFRSVYENCGDLNSEECTMALVKLYYYHI